MASFLFPFAWNARSLDHQCFLFFSMKFHIIKWEKWRIPIFANKFRGLGLEGLKVPKIRFLGFWQKSYPFTYTFLLQYEVPMFFFTFYQNNMFAIIWFLSYDPKTSECRIFTPQYLTKNWGIKLNFGIWLEVRESISWLLQVGMLRHAWTCLKWQQIVSQFYLQNELSYEVSFLHVVRKQQK